MTHTREDILHAYGNPLRIWDLGDGFTMMIGPNQAALILEVGYVEGDVAIVIIHAMPAARDMYLRWARHRAWPRLAQLSGRHLGAHSSQVARIPATGRLRRRARGSSL